MISLLKQKTLLYAEDDIVTQTLYKEYFEQYFKTIYLADNGQKAFELYKEKQPDVICLDINMPLISGLQLCKKIRQHDDNTRIILLTSRIDKETLLESIELGLSSYIEKPLSKLQLKQILIKLSGQFQAVNQILLCKQDEQQFIWDKEKQLLLCNSQAIHLTKNERRLLDLIVSSHYRIVDYQQIYNHIWFDNIDKDYSEQAIKALLKRMRDKLPEGLIINHYGLGYSLNKP